MSIVIVLMVICYALKIHAVIGLLAESNCEVSGYRLAVMGISYVNSYFIINGRMLCPKNPCSYRLTGGVQLRSGGCWPAFMGISPAKVTGYGVKIFILTSKPQTV